MKSQDCSHILKQYLRKHPSIDPITYFIWFLRINSPLREVVFLFLIHLILQLFLHDFLLPMRLFFIYLGKGSNRKSYGLDLRITMEFCW